MSVFKFISIRNAVELVYFEKRKYGVSFYIERTMDTTQELTKVLDDWNLNSLL